jgi:hypothetical protein
MGTNGALCDVQLASVIRGTFGFTEFNCVTYLLGLIHSSVSWYKFVSYILYII